jgi:hypothetical protein
MATVSVGVTNAGWNVEFLQALGIEEVDLSMKVLPELLSQHLSAQGLHILIYVTVPINRSVFCAAYSSD